MRFSALWLPVVVSRHLREPRFVQTPFDTFSSSLSNLKYQAEALVASGPQKHELQLKAAIAPLVAAGDTNGEAASKLFAELAHPEKYEFDTAAAYAIAKTLMDSYKYDESRGRQAADTYNLAKAAVSAGNVSSHSTAIPGNATRPFRVLSGPANSSNNMTGTLESPTKAITLNTPNNNSGACCCDCTACRQSVPGVVETAATQAATPQKNFQQTSAISSQQGITASTTQPSSIH